MGKLICNKIGFQVWVFRLRDVDKKVSIKLANSLKYSQWESLSIFLWARSVQINFRPTKRAADLLYGLAKLARLAQSANR